MLVKKSVEGVTIRPGKKFAGIVKVLQKAADDKNEDSLNKYLLKLLSDIHGYIPKKARRK